MVLYRLPIEKKLIALTANAEDEGVPGRSAAPYTWKAVFTVSVKGGMRAPQ